MHSAEFVQGKWFSELSDAGLGEKPVELGIHQSNQNKQKNDRSEKN
jgi:hypothetical protein